MKQTIALLTVILAATGCSTIRGEESESDFGSDDGVAVVFADEPADAAIEVGSASVSDAGAASEAINFVSTELYSRADIDGTTLFGGGGVMATFVQPGCEFSSEHAEILASAAADTESGVTYVFVHSGATREAFTQFVVGAGLDTDNIVHLDDMNGELSYRFGVDAYPATLLVDASGQLSSTKGALDAERLDRALAIVTSPSG